MFPSRLGLGSTTAAGSGDKVLQQQMKELTNIFRRVYRIYAHAWFQHREMFWRVESKTGLYILLKLVCDEYGLIPPENYTIPAEAEGLEPEMSQELSQLPVPILKRVEDSDEEPKKTETTKRHPRHAYSNSTPFASIIQEELEDEEGDAAAKPSLERQVTMVNLTEETMADTTDDVDVTAIITEADEPEEQAGSEAPLQLPETQVIENTSQNEATSAI